MEGEFTDVFSLLRGVWILLTVQGLDLNKDILTCRWLRNNCEDLQPIVSSWHSSYWRRHSRAGLVSSFVTIPKPQHVIKSPKPAWPGATDKTARL